MRSLVLTLSLLLAACGPPDPLLHLAEVVPDAGVVADLGAVAPDFGLALVVSPERVRLAPVGRFEGFDEDTRAVLEAVSDFSIAGGAFPEEDRKGMLISPLYDALMNRADAWKDQGDHMLIEEHDFRGQLWLLVDRRMAYEDLMPMVYSAGQAQYSEFQLIPFGTPDTAVETAPPEDSDEPRAVFERIDRTQRPDPMVGLRVGELPVKLGAEQADEPRPRFEVDDRGATFTISAPKDDFLSPALTMDTQRMQGVLEADPANPRLYASFAEAVEHAAHPVLPSLEVLLHISKGADDRMMAALERHQGPKRAAWIEGVVRAAAQTDDPGPALAWLAAGAMLGDQDPAGWGVDDGSITAARGWVQDFEAQPRRSKPLGIYSEAPDLQAIFRRDRFLLTPLRTGVPAERAVAEDLERLLVDQPAHSDSLMRDLALQAQLTNPSRIPAVFDFDPANDEHALLPPATSREVELMERLGGTAMVGPRTMELLVEAVKAGTVSLTPSEDSGWYDYQQWALEPLLTLPEAHVLRPDEGYVERLEKAFMAAIAMRRETHIKSLQLPAIGAAWSERVSITVAPDLRVEPLPAHYGRSAVAYDFLFGAVLEPYFDDDWEAWEDGAVQAELREAQRIYRDAAALAWADLGMEAEVETPVDDTVAWLDAWWTDPRMTEDPRFMIPFGEDALGRPIAWAVLGVKLVDVTVAYDEPPAVRSLDPGYELDVSYAEARYSLPVLVFAELPVAEILDRGQFRALADRHPQQRDLVEALGPRLPERSGGCAR